MIRRNPEWAAVKTLAIVAALAGLVGCSNPTGPSGSSGGGGSSNNGPVTQILWKNSQSGIWNTWFGDALTASFGNCTTAPVQVTDTISGDTWSLLVSGNGTPISPFFFATSLPNGDPNASSVLGGHLQFDIMLAGNPTGNLTVAYASNPGYACEYYTISLAGLSNASFTHESIPASSFTFLAGCPMASYSLISEPVYFGFSAPQANAPLIYLGNIQWTSY